MSHLAIGMLSVGKTQASGTMWEEKGKERESLSKKASAVWLALTEKRPPKEKATRKRRPRACSLHFDEEQTTSLGLGMDRSRQTSPV